MSASITVFRTRLPIADVGIAALLAAFLIFEIWVFNAPTDTPVVASIASVAAAGAIAFRRVSPFPALLVNVVSVGVLVWLGNPSAFYQWTNLIMVFSIAVNGMPIQRWMGLGLSLFGVWSSFLRRPEQGGVAALSITLAIWTIVWLVGLLYGGRLREEELRTARDEAAALAAGSQLRLELEEERLAMARELHDLLGHTVNVMLVHAEGGKAAIDRDPERARAAFETIADTARQTITNLERFLGILRRDTEPATRSPSPGLDSLPDLIADLEAVGVSVDLDVEGEIAGVPDEIAMSAFRITQAALTNTLRHAGAASAKVRVVIDDRVMSLDITDTGQGLTKDVSEGVGLKGIRERVALHGGDVKIRNLPAGGVQVACRFPLVAT